MEDEEREREREREREGEKEEEEKEVVSEGVRVNVYELFLITLPISPRVL